MIINKRINPYKAKALMANIINLDFYGFNKTINNKISLIFSKYFIDNSNWFLQYKESKFKKTIGLLAASINNNQCIDLNNIALDKITKKNKNKFIYQFIELQKRITNIMKIHNTQEFQAELIAFSSLQKAKGIGSKLINEFHNYLKLLEINKYCLFTDDNCDFDWYIKHQYRMIGKYQVKIDDLDLLFKNPNTTKYHIYKFYKEI